MRKALVPAATLTLLGALLLIAVLPVASALPVSSMPNDLREALNSAGYVLSDLSPVEQTTMSSAVGPDRALAVATKAFSSSTNQQVYAAKLTITGQHVTDEASPLTVQDRPAYVVQLTGLDLPRFGGRGQVDPTYDHHELIVFVDGKSAEWIAATDFR